MGVMFLLFLLSCISYTGYLCGYSSGLFSVFAALFYLYSISYIIYFGLLTKPAWSIYAYLFLWCLFPKGAIPKESLLSSLNLPYMPGVSLFSMIEIPAVLAIVVALVSRKKISIPKKLEGIFWLFVVTVVVAIIISLVNPLPSHIAFKLEFAVRFLSLASIFYALIFFLGCVAFIKTQRQVDILLFILMLTGIALTIEVIVLKHLGLFPTVHHFAFHTTGRFKSLLLNEYMGVGLHSMISICCAVYFIIISRRRYLFFLLIPLMFLPIIAVCERVHMLAVVLALSFFLLMAFRHSYLKALIITGLANIILFLVIFGDPFIDKLSLFLGETIRQGSYFSTFTLFTRFGIFARAIDIIIYSFPFGVGPGGIHYFMGDPPVPAHFLFSGSGFGEAMSYSYNLLISGKRITGAHNLYLNFIAEYGILGLITLTVLFFYVVSSFQLFKKRVKRMYDKYHNASYLAQVCSYAVFVGIGAYYLFTHTAVYYTVVFLFLYLIFLLPRYETIGDA